MKLIEVLRRTTAWFDERGIDSPRLDAEILIAHALGVSRLDLYLQHDRPLNEAELESIRPLVRARGTRKPVAYIVGQRDFYSLPFQVDERVLVPRPETEGLVERALERLGEMDAPVFADVGCGSGCIAVAVLANHPGARAHAIDVSDGALEVSAANAERNEVADRVTSHSGAGLEPLREHPDFGALDAVLSNPPYIVKGDPSVEPDVADHEPEVALYVSGDDPLEVVKQIAEVALEGLRPGGFVAFEVGAGSGTNAAEALTRLGYEDVEVVQDLAGIDRVVLGVRP